MNRQHLQTFQIFLKKYSWHIWLFENSSGHKEIVLRFRVRADITFVHDYQQETHQTCVTSTLQTSSLRKMVFAATTAILWTTTQATEFINAKTFYRRSQTYFTSHQS